MLGRETFGREIFGRETLGREILDLDVFGRATLGLALLGGLTTLEPGVVRVISGRVTTLGRERVMFGACLLRPGNSDIAVGGRVIFDRVTFGRRPGYGFSTCRGLA